VPQTTPATWVAKWLALLPAQELQLLATLLEVVPEGTMGIKEGLALRVR